ncbi:MAG TPA: Uma2 family endonuclease [Thermoanaerobaculia bacterium]|nr:Uma2 family endonuclease [Thermoanaerobaculia bacterium]
MAVRNTARRKLTYEDYLLFPDDGLRHEILDGEHCVTNAPSRWHQKAVTNLIYFFMDLLRREPTLGEVYTAPFEVLFSVHDVALPDLVFVSQERIGILTDKNIQGAPDLIVEVLSPTTRRSDETVKPEIYERFGVREYWLVDPKLQTVQVFRESEGSFVLFSELSGEDALTTPLLPGLAIPVSQIFR